MRQGNGGRRSTFLLVGASATVAFARTRSPVRIRSGLAIGLLPVALQDHASGWALGGGPNGHPELRSRVACCRARVAEAGDLLLQQGQPALVVLPAGALLLQFGLGGCPKALGDLFQGMTTLLREREFPAGIRAEPALQAGRRRAQAAQLISSLLTPSNGLSGPLQTLPLVMDGSDLLGNPLLLAR